jgi:hypothetical protein
MVELTPEGRRIVDDAAARYSFSHDAVRVLLEALVASGGGMAQFNHPDLGGMGQWSSGGMIMIGDMFNNTLKSRIASLCGELSTVVGRAGVFADRPASSQWQSQGDTRTMPLPESGFFVGDGNRVGDWWPADLGSPGSTGAQNNMRYAWFPGRQRLALDVNGQTSVYDTGDHMIGGFAQQQGGDQSLTFTSQHGVVRLDSLRLVAGGAPATGTTPMPRREANQPAAEASATGGDIFDSIERLAGLRDKGFISEEEFSAKKTELLKRL